MIEFVFQNETSEKKYNKGFFEDILRAAVDELEIDEKNLHCSLSLVDSEKIHQLNREHRQKDKPTDVLSFPLQTLDNLRGLNDIKDDTIDLGDIFICLEEAQKNANAEGTTLDRQLAFLTVHGFLHLLGFDHERSEADEDRMFTLQNRILHKIESHILN